MTTNQTTSPDKKALAILADKITEFLINIEFASAAEIASINEKNSTPEKEIAWQFGV